MRISDWSSDVCSSDLLGTATLGKETGKSVDLTFRKTKGATTFTIGAYHQDFDDYIFANTLDQFEDFRLIRYTAADATFTGVDGEVRHDFGAVGVSLFGDYVRAKLKGDLGNLPRSRSEEHTSELQSLMR